MRRKRFCIVLRDPLTGEVDEFYTRLYHSGGAPLASGHAHVATLAAKRGLEVLEIKPVPRGGFEPEEKAPQWEPSPEGIEYAKEYFNLTLPVAIKPNAHRGGRRGSYELRSAMGITATTKKLLPFGTIIYHHIAVKRWLTPERASKTLWHEFAHAKQAEAVIAQYKLTHPAHTLLGARDSWLQLSRANKKTAYDMRPWEIEARSFECMNDTMPLTKEV